MKPQPESKDTQEMPQVYESYYKCSKCPSIYHVSNFTHSKELHCRDCDTKSKVPKEAIEKSKKYR
jgi:DNA-directed RNA polymerase subunit RPC12/RpoP